MSIRTHIIKSSLLLSSIFLMGQIAEAVTVEVGGSIRPRVEYVDQGAQGQALNTSKTHTTMQSRINVKATVDESVSAFIQVQDVRTWGGELGSNATGTGAPPSITRTGTSTGGQVDFHQAYFTIKNTMGSNIDLKIGRQEMVFDEARLIGNIGWIQQAQSFDAARADFNNGNIGLTGFYAQTHSLDTHPTLPLTVFGNVTTGINESEFFGARATYKLGGKDRVTAYYYGSFNPDQTPVGMMEELHTAGLYLAYTMGGIRFRFDGAYQYGDISKAAGTTVDAKMLTVSIGKDLNIANGSRLEFWADYLSGDDNGLTDLKRQTFTTPYATNHKFYGHIDKFLQNPTAGLLDFVVKFDVKLTPKFKLQVHGHKFYSDKNLVAGTNNSNDLGSELDLDFSYDLAANTKFRAGYSRYFGHGLVSGGTTGNTTLNSNWAWGMFQMKF